MSLRRLLLAQLCLTLSVPFALAQTAPAAPATDPAKDEAAKPVPVVTTPGSSAASNEEVVELSPFQVTANNKGYYSANTMSGTRFNTKLDDLASSITVMTKEQMSDFGMLDINDIFLYVAGTEGTGTYTDYTLDRNGSLGDNVQNNPTQANRVRGIAPANVSLGNIETMGRVPVDPITVESVEVSRGPNANVFGLGNPSGTVNMVSASANLSRDRASTELRGDSYGGWRTSLDVNRVLLKDKLAVRVSGVRQYDGFERKPSGVDTERYNGMIKYRPFKNTTIAGSVFYYHAYGNRPNSLPPRDNLSYWIASGRPTWDPVTQQIHINGATVATVTAANYNGPDYFTASGLGNDRSQMFIDQNGLTYWSAPRGTTSTTGPSLATLQAARFLQPTAAAGAVFSGTAPRPFAQYLFSTTPTISDRSIYDYSSINLSSPNKFWDRTITSNFSIDQMIINTPTQTLAAQVSFMREDSARWTRNLLGTANDNGQTGQLTVDVNERLLDGTPNPFFLRTYIGVDKPRTQSNPQKWDTSRAQVAYRYDFTQRDNLLKHLGWVQLTGYGEYKYRVNRQYSWRDAMASNVSWIATNQYRGFQSAPTGPAVINLTQGFYRYYVGDTSGNNVDYAPSNFSYGTYPFVWGNAATGVFRTDPIAIAPVAADKTGGNLNTKLTLKTIGGVVQSHLFGDRLVTTLGARYDKTNLHYGTPGNPTNNFAPDGINFDYSLTDGWSPASFNNGGRTTNIQFVARPLFDTRFTANLDKGGSGSRFFGSLLNGMSLTYNRSNSFLPTNPAQDLFKNPLPNTTGTDKSWGLGFNLFDGKLVIRGTHYDNLQKDAQTNDMSTVAGRVLRIDFPTLGAGSPTPSHNLYGNALRWVSADTSLTPTQVTDKVQQLTGISAADLAYYSNATPPIGATSDVRSVGTEIEINYNPTRYWTFTGSVTDTKSVTQNISSALVNWINERMPTWTSVQDPSIRDADAIAEGNPNKYWWLHHYTQSGTAPALGTAATYTASAATPQDNYNAFVKAPFAIMQAQEGKNNPQVRRYAFRGSTSYQLAGISDHTVLKHMTVGGAIRWEDKAAIGYMGVQSLPAIITDLDPNRPIYDKAHYYVDMFVSYKTKLWSDKIGATFKFNVRNLGENGRLQPVGAFPDGSIHTFRIVDPQQFILTASFDL
jgi:outer membrane receptor protein involved in Fe transport